MSLSYLCTGFESQGPADCRQTVVRGSENEGRCKSEDVRGKMADGE